MNKLLVGAAVIVLLVVAFVLYQAGTSSGFSFGDDRSPVMYFYQDSCPHCIAMKPIMNDLATKGYRVKLMDAQTHTNYWTQYNISGTPTWKAANGDTLVGEQSEDALQAWFDSHGAKIA